MATNLVPGALITPTLRLVRPLGQGGMGSVWIADHLAFHTQVVVKFMSEELAQNQDALARFSREAAAASQVKSPHVVHMIEFGVGQNGRPFIAMELLEGKDLSQILARYGALHGDGALKVVTQVARALGRAHEKGIIHRDIKPENIFLIDAGGGEIFAKVLDFGVAKAALADAVRTTGTGMMVGTPLYMSPEQVLGERTIDHRSDLWSLGVVAFEALTGGVPFGGETVGAISVAICHAPMPKPSERNSNLGPPIDAWFARACARDLSQRFASAKELAEGLAAAVAENEALPHDETVVSAPAAATAPAREVVATPRALAATMIEVSEETHVVRPQATAGHATTNGATSRSPELSPLAPPKKKPLLDRRLVFVVAGFVLAAFVFVLAVIAMRSGSSTSDETTRRPAHRVENTGAVTTVATSTAATPIETPGAGSSSPSDSESTDAPPADSEAPPIAESTSAAVPKPLPPPAKTTTSPKSTATSTASSKPPKPKGKNVVIE